MRRKTRNSRKSRSLPSGPSRHARKAKLTVTASASAAGGAPAAATAMPSSHYRPEAKPATRMRTATTEGRRRVMKTSRPRPRQHAESKRDRSAGTAAVSSKRGGRRNRARGWFQTDGCAGEAGEDNGGDEDEGDEHFERRRSERSRSGRGDCRTGRRRPGRNQPLVESVPVITEEVKPARHRIHRKPGRSTVEGTGCRDGPCGRGRTRIGGGLRRSRNISSGRSEAGSRQPRIQHLLLRANGEIHPRQDGEGDDGKPKKTSCSGVAVASSEP